MKLIFRIFCTAATLWLAGFTTLQAQANLSVQGTIQNFDGSAVDNGSYDVTFKLYSTESGGTAVWSETQSVNVVGGVYSVLLGSSNPLTAAFDQTYYLGITLPGGPELTPRSRLTSSPYALSLIGQDNKFPSTGPVGAGTASPAAGYQLHTKNPSGDGKVLIEGVGNAKIDFKSGSNTASITYDGNNINIQNLNLVFDSGINLPAGQTIKYNGLSDWRLVDADDFETSTEGWANYLNYTSSTVNTSNVSREQMGAPTNNGYVYLGPTSTAFKKAINLAGIPHKQVKVVFTLYFLDRFQSTDYFQAWGGFSNTLTPNANTSGQLIVGWSQIKSSDQPASVIFANNSGDSAQRGEMVVSNSSDTIYAIFQATTNGTYGAFALSNIEIWVK